MSNNVIFDDGKLQVRNIGGENVYYVKKGRYWSIVNSDKFSNAEGKISGSVVAGLSMPMLMVGVVLGIVIYIIRD